MKEDANFPEALGHFATVTDSLPAAVVLVAPDGMIALANRQAEALFGYDRGELIGQTIEKLVPARFANHSRLRMDYQSNPESRPMGVGRDLYGRRKDDSEFPVEIGLSLLQAENRSFVIAAVVDITWRKKTQDELRHAYELLEQRVSERTAELAGRAEELARARDALARSNLELQQFAYVASHDLQTPLRNISGFAQLLQRTYAGRFDQQGEDWLERIVLGTKRMHSLVRDLLAYARVDSAARPFERASLNDICDDVVSWLAPAIRDAGATVTRGDLPTVTGDRNQLIQLLQNLISNGILYRGTKDPHVHVSVTTDDDEQWIICVKDNGIGIDARHHERIFEIFQRLHTQREYPGTGIGLAVCRRVVHRHGGEIWLESAPGEGSRFLFKLPKSAEANHE